MCRSFDRAVPKQWLRRAVARCAPRLFVRCFTPDDRELGELGEEIVARTLRGLGYRVLARRMQTPDGEVDILAHDGTRHVCVEVKTGRIAPIPRPRGAGAETLDLRWRPGARLSAAQARRLGQVVRRLDRLCSATDRTRSSPKSSHAARLDLFEVFYQPHGRSFWICHHRDLRTRADGCSTARSSAWLA